MSVSIAENVSPASAAPWHTHWQTHTTTTVTRSAHVQRRVNNNYNIILYLTEQLACRILKHIQKDDPRSTDLQPKQQITQQHNNHNNHNNYNNTTITTITTTQQTQQSQQHNNTTITTGRVKSICLEQSVNLNWGHIFRITYHAWYCFAGKTGQHPHHLTILQCPCREFIVDSPRNILKQNSLFC